MELALSLGDGTPKGFSFLDLDKAEKKSKDHLGFCMALGKQEEEEEEEEAEEEEEEEEILSSSLRCNNNKNNNNNNNIDDENYDDDHEKRSGSSSDPPPVQLNLLPLSPVPRTQASSSHLRFLLLSAGNLAFEPGSTRTEPVKGVELNRRAPRFDKEAEDVSGAAAAAAVSSSSFHMDFNNPFYNKDGKLLLLGKRSVLEATPISMVNENDQMVDNRGASSSRASDEEEIINGGGGASRKKLRLSKEQSAFLEECFKEHTTLNPKEKLALANQLNLRPRQVEVWFQNRRARTKLKQTEVDCEYLKRCCEALTEENRRLQKELQELRALKISKPFYMQLPATTLTMCPSCERVVSSAAAARTTLASTAADTGLSLAKPNLLVTFSSPAAEFKASKAAS